MKWASVHIPDIFCIHLLRLTEQTFPNRIVFMHRKVGMFIILLVAWWYFKTFFPVFFFEKAETSQRDWGLNRQAAAAKSHMTWESRRFTADTPCVVPCQPTTLLSDNVVSYDLKFYLLCRPKSQQSKPWAQTVQTERVGQLRQICI